MRVTPNSSTFALALLKLFCPLSGDVSLICKTRPHFRRLEGGIPCDQAEHGSASYVPDIVSKVSVLCLPGCFLTKFVVPLGSRPTWFACHSPQKKGPVVHTNVKIMNN